MKYCIGIDLGGTYVKFGLLDDRRRPGETFQLRTAENGDDIARQMIHGARKLMSDNDLGDRDVVGVGIGSPAPLNLKEGIVIRLANLPGIKDFPIRDRVAQGLGLPAVLENDANVAAYGEYLCGAGRAAADIVLLTLGTGLGSGIIIDGRILHGAHELGGEIGHMIVQPGGERCGCGQLGCLERYGSASYIALRASRMIEQDGRRGLLAATFKQKGAIDARDIAEAAAAGDELAVEVWDRCAYYLAVGCVSICRIFDPDRIILGGGMAKAGERLLEPVREHFRKLHWSLTDIRTDIELAALGNDAGVIGAAGVAWTNFGKE